MTGSEYLARRAGSSNDIGRKPPKWSMTCSTAGGSSVDDEFIAERSTIGSVGQSQKSLSERRGGKMSTGKLLLYLFLYFLLAGCQPISMQSAFNPNSYPPPPLGTASGNPPYGIYPGSMQSPAAQSRRTEYIWEKALQGMAMGGAVG